MISSMTGYANASRELQGASLVLEMRAVNHRYLEVMFRSPDELRAIEPQCREMLAASLSRGKVEVRISFNRPAEAQTSLQLNQELLQQLFAVSDSVRAIRSEAGSEKRWANFAALAGILLQTRKFRPPRCNRSRWNCCARR